MFDIIRSSVLMAYMAAFVTLIGCSSAEKVCPTQDQESVSMCRAEERCRQEKTTYGLGLGMHRPTDSNIVGTRTVATTDNYNNCIEKDLNDQRSQKQVLDSEATQ